MTQIQRRAAGSPQSGAAAAEAMPQADAAKRRTFAIISHPDAGKTTITEKLLLLGNAISLAGTVKARKANRHAASDWMDMERERGISVTTSVMQFPYRGHLVNLLDTPGHEDFSEDTYRTLSAVDSALMVIDGAKGVEPRTLKLMEVCRLRDTPVISFVNKLDRAIREPLELMDEIEKVLQIQCAPMNWPLGSGRHFQGVYDLAKDAVEVYQQGHGSHLHQYPLIEDLGSPEAHNLLGDDYDALIEEIELVRGAAPTFDLEGFRQGALTPVYFGTALGNFGVQAMLDGLVAQAPGPQPRTAASRSVRPEEERFSGFVFKIQANMDPRHRDRIAFLRVCSGRYEQGMKLRHVRTGKTLKVGDALCFMAGDRSQAASALPGDIIGLHNHGAIQIGDSFSEGETLEFLGVPNFAPELFRLVRSRDPLKNKQLEKGLDQLAEEGAAQLFKPLARNDLVVGAVGALQFDLIAHRLREEYRADCLYEQSGISAARWVVGEDRNQLDAFRRRHAGNLAIDGGGHLAYLAPSQTNLQLTEERWPELEFRKTRERRA